MRTYYILFIIGALIVMTGAFMFIQQIDKPMARNFLLAGLFIEFISIILIVYNVAKKARK